MGFYTGKAEKGFGPELTGLMIQVLSFPAGGISFILNRADFEQNDRDVKP